jgi:hypothetical protein
VQVGALQVDRHLQKFGQCRWHSLCTSQWQFSIEN